MTSSRGLFSKVSRNSALTPTANGGFSNTLKCCRFAGAMAIDRGVAHAARARRDPDRARGRCRGGNRVDAQAMAMTDQTIQPIETIYRGYRFRSRLEARWAVFFQTLGVPWEYEP